MAATSSKESPSLTGWRRTAVYLTIFIILLTSLLIGALFASIFGVNDENSSLWGESLLYRGDCDWTSRTNLWIHLAINMLSTGILASSNFFMQALVAPTRHEVDKAHSIGEWMEIGVQSIRNFRFISRRKITFWFLFSLSSTPLHLVFNGCVLESKATTSFKLLMVSEEFLKGASYTVPALTLVKPNDKYQRNDSYYKSVNETIGHIYQSYHNDSNNWERLEFSDCMSRYNDIGVAMVRNRHVIMIVSNTEETTSAGWTPKQVNKNLADFDNVDSINSLWCEATYQRTGARTGNDLISEPKNETFTFGVDFGLGLPTLNLSTGELRMKGTNPTFQSMQIQYCLSEKFTAPCQLTIANSLLFVVCIMCIIKCLLCIITLKMRIWGDEDPLMTPGDAIASFITNPGIDTKDMCTLSYWDFDEHKRFSSGGRHGNYTKLVGPRLWVSDPKRRPSKAIPRQIWYLSYIIIEGSLFVAAVFLAIAVVAMPIGESKFAHNPVNAAVGVEGLQSMSLIGLTMLSNTPQLALSICYMASNGLLTRMLTEFEWSRYSTDFRTLRVTVPKGQQRSTYRLQLPYRWSIPLLTVSGVLHWIYSNCLYVNYAAEWPYQGTADRGLQYSTVAIVIAFLVSLFLAFSPPALATFRLPGKMVLGGSNSKVISAACHGIPMASACETPESTMATVHLLKDTERDVNILSEMATRRLRWGQVLDGSKGVETGHLAFGVEEQGIVEPTDGKLYKGYT
ncbi:hypothetical protein FALBO_14546 [Fusarium albosuccineum]|uniref:DUF6536 domain-containing protein n=1 Tax=Fusarium albosuccineum TaxID=1237068 RepID=A0A8H4KYM8_9HYPO|nr:hypothetical protein FALBO_14546 [Fusarium albosuccineum]